MHQLLEESIRWEMNRWVVRFRQFITMVSEYKTLL